MLFQQMQVKNVNGSISGYLQTPPMQRVNSRLTARQPTQPSLQRSQGLFPRWRKRIASRPSVGCQKGQKCCSVKRVNSRLSSEYTLQCRDQKGSIQRCHKLCRDKTNKEHVFTSPPYKRIHLTFCATGENFWDLSARAHAGNFLTLLPPHSRKFFDTFLPAAGGKFYF